MGSRVSEAELEPHPCGPLTASRCRSGRAQKAEKPPGMKECGLLDRCLAFQVAGVVAPRWELCRVGLVIPVSLAPHSAHPPLGLVFGLKLFLLSGSCYAF